MDLPKHPKSLFVTIVCYLYALLFIYAAASKLFDFQNFQAQLGQSPILGAFAITVSWSVPVLELLLSAMLLLPATRPVGLFGAYLLMVLFTAYIFIILHYASFIPCSCGGILERMGWREHLIFNVAFVVLAAWALLLYHHKEKPSWLRRAALMLVGGAVGTGIMGLLYAASENIVHYHNTLTRSFPHTPASDIRKADLRVNSYYIAGVGEQGVFLGNTTAPLLITVLDSSLALRQQKVIRLDKKLPFKGITLAVVPPYFFVADGTVPCLFSGRTSDWNARLAKQGGEYFTTVEAVDSARVCVRTHSPKNGDGILGMINTRNGKTILNPYILQKQFDGVFDTDGQLLYSAAMERLVYVYAYRNQFTVATPSLAIDYRGNTIDTNTVAKLEVVKVRSRGERKMGKPPLIVNKSSTVFSNLLFINSGIPGRFEDDRMWKGASIIDVYDLSRKSYLLSFLIYDADGKKVRDFAVYKDRLYALAGSTLICCRLDAALTRHYTQGSLKK